MRDCRERAASSRGAGRHPLPRARQRGAALLFVVLLLIVGIGLFVVNASQETVRAVQADRIVSETLGQVRDALVAYAAAHPSRPGALPCPDGDNNGDADGVDAVTGLCPTYLGRVPWRTLGLGDVRDDSAERFWYALSDNFRDFVPISSDTQGNREVRTGPSATVTTTQAAAVVFAPGGAIGNQSRDVTPVLCTTTGTVLPRDRCAANYLEGIGATNNAAAGGTGPFIAGEPNATFNDRLVMVRVSDIMPLVERRVAGDMRRVYLEYREAARQGILSGGCNCYPWADADRTGTSKTGYSHGRIPLAALPHPWSPPPPKPPLTINDGTGKAWAFPALPPYFATNGWDKVIYYAVGANATDGIGTKCISCTKDPLLPPPAFLKGSLSVDKNNGQAVVFITPGSAGPGRAKGWTGNWGDYIDDSANRDGDDRFVTPASKSLDRDRIILIADDLPPASCATNAQMLVYNAPCHTTGTSVKKICQKAHDNLQLCSQCSFDAYEMLQEPCRNSLNPPECQGYVKVLQGCKK